MLRKGVPFKSMKKRPILIFALLTLVVLIILNAAQGQSGLFGGIMNYDPGNNWVLVNDRTGTWHAPMAFHNSAAPSNSITEFTVNTDNQFEIQTFNVGTLASYLDLDTDGSAALYGAGGGGVGVEAATGDTCIPATATAPCAAAALRVGPNGTIKQYRGQPTMGNGISTIQYYADATLTGSFGPYTIFTTKSSGYASSGMYRLSGYISATNTDSGATMQFATGYSDEAGSQIQNTGTPLPFGAYGDKLPFSFVLYSVPGKPITISTITTSGSTYTIHLRLEAL
jgi:hypothetical protein